jgi:FO synthase
MSVDRSNDRDLTQLLLTEPLPDLLALARAARDAARPHLLTYSRKVFIPLTQLCRDVCHYCTFAQAPRRLANAYMPVEQVLEIARAGAAAGCKEALFTLGDKPELRYAAARAQLEKLGFATTVEYLGRVAARVLEETGLVPHINAGVLGAEDYRRLRKVSGSMGLMLESASERLCARGGPHYGSPDKHPAARLGSIAAAGEAAIPFTTGLLIGIGETREERLEGLFAIRDLHGRFGHIQEVIIQNFRAKAGTRMAQATEPSEEELLWTVAAARLVMGGEVGVQSPPNLNPGRTASLIAAGLDDWGGISPVTIDHVNPEAPWPQIENLARECELFGRVLAERLTVYPAYARDPAKWLDPKVAKVIRQLSDAEDLARDSAWSPGLPVPAPGSPAQPLGVLAQLGSLRESLSSAAAPQRAPAPGQASPALLSGFDLERAVGRVIAGGDLQPHEIARLLTARGPAAEDIVSAADELRRTVCGDVVTYVLNRNINYTNICTYSCSFCAFSKSSTRSGARDHAYDLPLEEIAARTREAAAKGATEVCLQGGIHPRYTGQTYLDILRTVKAAQPGIHVHAFSPLEVSQGAAASGLSLEDFLRMLKDEGLGSLPGTAAEILDDEVREVLCPDKLNTAAWLDVVRTAHRVGLPTTATIMFGHLEKPIHSARHLAAIRRVQRETGGFTEFVPLPFVHMRSPVYTRGMARRGPTWRETVLMHAVARIALHGAIASIQASWVKLGIDGAAACLAAGVNDLGGVLMNESISRAAGASHGQELTVAELEGAAHSASRVLRQRTTLYGQPGRQDEPAPELSSSAIAHVTSPLFVSENA